MGLFPGAQAHPLRSAAVRLDLRHTYASLLIAQSGNVAFASRQLGHASVSTTLNVYTHLFDHAEHAKTVIERLEGRFGDVLTANPSQPHPSTLPRYKRRKRSGNT